MYILLLLCCIDGACEIFNPQSLGLQIKKKYNNKAQ